MLDTDLKFDDLGHDIRVLAPFRLSFKIFLSGPSHGHVRTASITYGCAVL